MRWACASGDQLFREIEGRCRRIAVAKPTGVGGHGREEVVGHGWRQRNCQRLKCLVNQPPRGFRSGVNETCRGQILGEVVVDHDLVRGQLGEKCRKVAELVFGSGVQHDDSVDVAPGVARQRKPLDGFAGIEKVVTRRPSAGNNAAHRFAARLQRFAEGQQRAETIGIGTDVGGEQETLMFADKAGKRSPIKRHRVPFVAGRVKEALY